MKLRFLQTCQDKRNGKMYDLNKVYEFDEERGREILKTRYAVEVKEIEPEKDEKQVAGVEEETIEENSTVEEVEEETLDEKLDAGEMVNLHDLKLDELKKLAKEEGVAVRGTKEEIIERIMSNHE